MTHANETRLAQSLPSSVPFVGPETMERAQGRPFAARLGANENIFGPSPLAIHAMAEGAKDNWMYGDPENHDLIHALSTHHNVGPESIIVGEGIDGLLGYLARLFIEPGDAVVTSEGAYPTFNFHVAGYGGVLHTAPFKNDHEDPDALIAKAHDVNAKLIYIANPDNPMGSHHKADVIHDMITRIPDGALLVLDEAYIEFAPEGTAPAFDTRNPNVIRFRTFSKAYGMAGARVGYAIGEAARMKSFHKIRNHFGMCRSSQLGALAALQDQAHLQSTLKSVTHARKRIGEIAADNGLTALPSATNFVAIDCGQGGDFAKRIVEELTTENIFVRMPFAAPQDRCIRVSCAPDDDLNLFAAALPRALKRARA
ncbi:MAG: pyridoxal phosphate-dependent aminotransferase [Halocynthiibacter sp.]